MKAKVCITEIGGYEHLSGIAETVMKTDAGFFMERGSGLFPDNRYAYLGTEPFLVFQSKGDRITVVQDGNSSRFTGDPFAWLNRYYSAYPVDPVPGFAPFTGGAAGYFGYDMGRRLETVPEIAAEELLIPDSYFGFYSLILIADHAEKKLFAAATGLPETAPRLQSLKAQADIRRIRRLVSNRDEPSFSGAPVISGKVESNFTKTAYCEAISRIKSCIGAGDVYQVNLSQRFACRSNLSPVLFFKQLTEINPSPYACFFNCGSFQVISASPERFLQICGDRIQTRPIKGTRARGETRALDNRLKKELISSPKDRAELLMIIDLERNDLGRICRYGTVTADPLFSVEAYRDVYHLVSTVRGVVDSEKYGIMDCIAACFPGGSITGAPKIRAMQMIESLEPCRRQVYTGAIGYLGFNRQVDLNIAIRTAVCKDGVYRFNLGGGIVADSEPEAEYEETLSKGRVFFEILGRHHHGPAASF